MMKTPPRPRFADKAAARAWARAPLPADDVAAASALIARRLLAQDWMQLPSPLGLYRSAPAEVATAPFYAAAQANGWDVAAPVAAGPAYGWRTDDADAPVEAGPHGILQPVGGAAADPAGLRVVLVPGLAFDRRGARLGHGGGHYDRLLAAAQRTAFLVGLCFDARLADTLPAGPLDVPMDAIVTERAIHYAPAAEAKLARLCRPSCARP